MLSFFHVLKIKKKIPTFSECKYRKARAGKKCCVTGVPGIRYLALLFRAPSFFLFFVLLWGGRSLPSPPLTHTQFVNNRCFFLHILWHSYIWISKHSTVQQLYTHSQAYECCIYPNLYGTIAPSPSSMTWPKTAQHADGRYFLKLRPGLFRVHITLMFNWLQYLIPLIQAQQM